LVLFGWLAPPLLSHAQIPSQAPAATVSSTPRHTAQVNDPALAARLAAGGARRIADYGGFQLFDIDQATATALVGRIQLRDEYNVIKLNAAPLDTSLPQLQSLRKPVAAFAGKRMHLIQFAGPVQPAWRESLLQAGVEIVSYIPQNAYLVYGGAGALGRVQALAAQAPHVQWEGSYLDDYKIHPAARAVDAQGQPRQIGTDLFDIQMMADAEANAKTLQLLDALKLEPFQRQSAALHYLNVAGRFAPADLARIAAQPDVVSILPYFKPRKLDERQDQIAAGNLSGNAPGGPGYLAWLESKGFSQAQFDASGFAVDLSDSGIDDGTTTPNHFGLYRNGQISDGSRVIYNRLEGAPNPGSSLKGCDGHGTLNSHIVGGYDDSSGFPFEDSSGYHYGLGVCPFVRLGSSVIFDPDQSTNPDLPTLESYAYQHGARVNNNSWGDTGSDGLYNSDAQTYDALVRDADAATAGNQEMVIVFAAGNDGINARGRTVTKSISAPATAKNIITVGAAQNVVTLGGLDGCGWSDNYSDNANAIFSYSGRGPCDDGRHKPDIMAPGTRITGGVPQAKNPADAGTADPCFLADGIGVCGGVATNTGTNLFFPDGQQFYTISTGTSHSTPAVSGGCALLRQYFINQGWTPPSAAMTKAFLMNSARYMTGPGANDSLWSENQGMGEMNLGMAFDGSPRLLRDQLPADLFTASGQTRTYSGTVADSAKPFRVTLAWSDAPGSTTGSAANNDLDLTVAIGGVTYLGNVFNGAFSVSGGSADTLDNVESVFLPAGVSGNFTITVTAANINSVGVPNSGGALEQDFALAAYNALLTVPPPVILSPVSGFDSSVPLVIVSGTGLPGARLAIYDAAGLLSSTVVNQNGDFTGVVQLAPGAQTLTAIQSELGVASAPSAPVVVWWVVPPPVILAPSNGLVTTDPSLTVSGTGMAAATVTLYDNSVSNSAVTVNSTGHFFFPLKLANGPHSLTAVQTANGLSSLPCGPVLVTMALAPFVVLEPQSQSMFLKGSVTFAAKAAGATPLRYSWLKNGVKVAGADEPSLTLGGITAASAGTYTLVATNSYGRVASDPVTLALIPNPFTNLAGNYYGLFSETPARFPSSGRFTLSLTRLGAYSGNLQGAGGPYAFTGAFSPAGRSAPRVPRGYGKTPLALSLALDVTNGTQQILGTVADGSWAAALEADLAFYSATNPSPWRGADTIILDSSGGGVAGPGGGGYGKVTVTPAGMVSFIGALSDNTAVAPSAAGVSKYGRWPLYIPLYGTGTLGSLSGWVTFTNLPGVSLQGGAAWFRTNSAGKLYPRGFTNAVSITGSAFTPASAKTPVLGLTNFQITLSGGNLPHPLTNAATLSPAGKFAANGPGIASLTLSVAASTGILNGTFLDPATGLATPIRGVVLQQQTNAAGYFLSTNATGLFQLTPP